MLEFRFVSGHRSYLARRGGVPVKEGTNREALRKLADENGKTLEDVHEKYR